MTVLPEKNFDIKKLTSFKIGGKISEVFFPENIEEFVQILKEQLNAKVFGNLSNTLVSDDGYDGKIILTTKMNSIQIEGTKVIADSGVKGHKIITRGLQSRTYRFRIYDRFPRVNWWRSLYERIG